MPHQIRRRSGHHRRGRDDLLDGHVFVLDVSLLEQTRPVDDALLDAGVVDDEALVVRSRRDDVLRRPVVGFDLPRERLGDGTVPRDERGFGEHDLFVADPRTRRGLGLGHQRLGSSRAPSTVSSGTSTR
ncbi:hypothetical protein ACFQMM_10720 [Saliphagus sp. GCM10025308]